MLDLGLATANAATLARAAPAFTPASLTFGTGGAWYDPSDLTTLYQSGTRASPGTAVAADGDPVGLMLDKSGNNFDLSQATSTLRPIYKIDGSGKPYLKFDGVDDYLASAAIWAIAFPFDRLTALQQVAWTAGSGAVWLVAGGSIARVRQAGTTPALRAEDGSVTNTLSTSSATIGSNVLLIERHVSAASQLAVNSEAFSAAVNAGTVAPPATSILSIGGGSGGVSANIRFYGAIVAPQLGSSDLANAKTWLGAKASLSL